MTSTPGTVPVSAGDRLSDVLARDEALVEVFVRHAPHFAKLRNRAMRRVMARLVTVEEAARTAQISADELVHELNAALGFVSESSHSPSANAAAPVAASGPAAHRPPAANVVELDVRDDLRSGREPFSRIMSAVAALRDEDVLHLRAIFEPVPLFTALAKRGFAHESEAHAPDDWSVWFWRPSPADGQPATEERAHPAAHIAQDDGHATYLDVRGLTPPEPMLRTLVALESLPAGHALVQINTRIPEFLLPVLAERGFTYAIDASLPDRVLVRISHG